MRAYVFHPGARHEYAEAASYYEQRKPGLGARFSLEVEAAIGRIFDAPMRWPLIEDHVRRCMLHTFPYGLPYSVEHDFILILAAMHRSREPGYWKNRLPAE